MIDTFSFFRQGDKISRQLGAREEGQCRRCSRRIYVLLEAYGISCMVGNTVVRESDIALFSVFNNGHHAADQVYFYESNSKKIVTLAVRARPKKI